jgi:hypothetical protein
MGKIDDDIDALNTKIKEKEDARDALFAELRTLPKDAKDDRDYYKDRISVLDREIERLDTEKLERIKQAGRQQQTATSSDALLAVFLRTESMRGSSQVTSNKRVKVSKAYHNKCWLCGRESKKCDVQDDPNHTKYDIPLTAAHIVSGVDPHPGGETLPGHDSMVKLVQALDDPRYGSKFSFSDPRNLIQLCGTKGQPGTCHHAFDNHACTVLTINDQYYLYWYDLSYKPEAAPLGKRCPYLVHLNTPPKKARPYRRALFVHAIRAEAMYKDVVDDRGEEYRQMRDYIVKLQSSSYKCKESDLEESDVDSCDSHV